ncbi:hypothetical protein BsWGS_29040 [Bradybaena similaris]
MANSVKHSNELSNNTNSKLSDASLDSVKSTSQDRPTTTQSIHLQFESENQQTSLNTDSHSKPLSGNQQTSLHAGNHFKPTLIHSSSMIETSRMNTDVSNSVHILEIRHSNSASMIRSQTEDKTAGTDEIDVILARKISSMDLRSVGRSKSKLSLASVAPEEPTWRDVGEFEELRRTRCRRLYSRLGPSKDLALFYRKGKFFAMEAWCSHMGGPLFEGDIEDHKGVCHVMCPWHAFMFDLSTGESDIGLKQQVYPVKCENGHVFVEYVSQLALYPYL